MKKRDRIIVSRLLGEMDNHDISNTLRAIILGGEDGKEVLREYRPDMTEEEIEIYSKPNGGIVKY